MSACLLGQKVRFDGGHKRDAFLTDIFGRYVEWVAVCPEVEIGLGTPRDALRLIDAAPSRRLRLVAPASGNDITDRMETYAALRAARLEDERLSGYVLKKDSPSCGMERVRVYGTGGVARTGRGVFATALIGSMPDLPVEEEGRLNDAKLRENFVERVFAFARLRALFEAARTNPAPASRRPSWHMGDLVAFHTAHKLTLMAHSPVAYRELGRFVATAKGRPAGMVERTYRSAFMKALARPATPGRHANVLHHIAGFFKTNLDAAAKTELLTIVDDFRRGLVPRVVPLTLLRHYVARFDNTYLAGQVYLDPHPKELMLQNHV
ncbi:MAG: DUF523 and DUF1722 domain-containing protein [Vicinamibacterales bacterium]